MCIYRGATTPFLFAHRPRWGWKVAQLPLDIVFLAFTGRLLAMVLLDIFVTSGYGVATMSRLLQIIGLFCRMQSFL